MDSIPSYEFHKIFRRLSYDVDLKGAFTPEDIDERLAKVQRKFKKEAKRTAASEQRKRLRKKAKAIEILQDKNFAGKTIAEATRSRYGIVNLTLHYGRKKAEEMKLDFSTPKSRRLRVRRKRRRRR